MLERLMRKIVQMLDPKLDKYRDKKPRVPAKYTPQTLKDFIAVIQRTPKNILSDKDRERIAAIMSFDDRTVGDLMTDKDKIVFVKKDEILGPLILDRLYKSGFKSFPVIDSQEKVIGVIHTEALNALEIKKTDKAARYMDERVNYLHVNDSLETAVEEIKRTDCCYFLVLNKREQLTGCLTIQMLLEYLVGRV